MALAFYFSPMPVMSAQQYDECIKRLRRAGAGHPPGRVYHACFGTNESVNVFDVWTSQAAFEKFGQTLMPILKQLSVDPGQPRVMAVRKVIVPPAAPARSAVRKRSPGKRAAKSNTRTRARRTR